MWAGAEIGAAWLGAERVTDEEWRLPISDGVISGARALFGGCATAAASIVAGGLAPQPLVFVATHFGALAPLGSEVMLRGRVMAAGRTMTHVEVEGSVDGNQSFLARVTAGDRPAQAAEGQWVVVPDVPDPDGCVPFEHPVHEGTWAGRFEWRLAGRDGDRPAARWWVRPRPGEEIDPLTAAVVLVDYVTYGVGRALDVPMGGLSVDNVVRVHRPTTSAWWLLDVVPDAIDGGFGSGTARLFGDSALAVTGTQSIVVNGWDWRLEHER